MAAISGTFSAAGISASFTPTTNVSDVVISPRKGSIRLEVVAPVGTPQLISNSTGAYEVLTADASLTYQFVATGDEVDIDYYMGP